MDLSKATQQFPELLNIYLLYNKYRSNSNIQNGLEKCAPFLGVVLDQFQNDELFQRHFGFIENDFYLNLVDLIWC